MTAHNCTAAVIAASMIVAQAAIVSMCMVGFLVSGRGMLRPRRVATGGSWVGLPPSGVVMDTGAA